MAGGDPSAVIPDSAQRRSGIQQQAHATSVVVWSVPAAVVAGERFAVAIGVKSAAGCALAGGRVEVVDDAGTVSGAGALGDAPWPGTAALYYSDVAMAASGTPGTMGLSARFMPEGMAEPHQAASAAFDVAVVARPEHTLTVTVSCAGRPVAEAHLRLGPHRGVTDADGRATIKLAKGRYQLVVWKAGYDTPDTPLQIDADAAVSVEATAEPEDHPDAHWTA